MEELYKVSAQEARVQLSDMINRAVYSRQPSLITRQGKPTAVLIAFDQWQSFQQWQQEKDTPPVIEVEPEFNSIADADSEESPVSESADE